jgi:hypothetical protein
VLAHWLRRSFAALFTLSLPLTVILKPSCVGAVSEATLEWPVAAESPTSFDESSLPRSSVELLPFNAGCESYLERVQQSSLVHWSPSSTLYDDSVTSTVVSSVFWLSAVEAYRQSGQPNPALTATFGRTLLPDIFISLVSHRIGVGDLPWLERILSGQWAQGKKAEFVSRVAANSVLNSAIISLSWAVTGIDVSGREILGALGLCGGVYTGLQFFNDFFYKSFPFKKDAHFKEKLSTQLGEEMAVVFDAARANAQNLGITEEEAETFLVSNLEASLTSRPYEEDIEQSPELRKVVNRERTLKKIAELKTELSLETQAQKQLKITQKLMKLRRELINRLLTLEKAGRTGGIGGDEHAKIQRLLSLGAPFNLESSLNFHSLLRDRYSTYQSRLRFASFLKQSLAVGLAGGVFLYNTTHWAAYGR